MLFVSCSSHSPARPAAPVLDKAYQDAGIRSAKPGPADGSRAGCSPRAKVARSIHLELEPKSAAWIQVARTWPRVTRRSPTYPAGCEPLDYCLVKPGRESNHQRHRQYAGVPPDSLHGIGRGRPGCPAPPGPIDLGAPFRCRSKSRRPVHLGTGARLDYALRPSCDPGRRRPCFHRGTARSVAPRT
ncbi:hypothetical protein D3C85_302920 [compost metagenome]